MAGKRILVIEDHQEAAAVLAGGLSKLEPALSTVCVTSAEEALHAFETQSFDLLIADVLLPGISGLELMARFRRRNPQTRVILLSGVHDEEIRKQVARSGADAFFFKPVELADVLDAVERQLGLVKSALPSELAVIRSAQEPAGNTAQLLAELRFNLQAHSAMLLSAEGRVLARAGALPDADIEQRLAARLPGLMHASTHVASLVNNGAADDLMTVRGPKYTVHLASVAPAHALALVTKPLNGGRFAALAEAVQKTVVLLRAVLAQPQEAPIAEDGLTDTDPHLERLLDLADTKPTSRRAAESYWQAAELAPLPQPGAISYAQAAQIGLVPSQEN